MHSALIRELARNRPKVVEKHLEDRLWQSLIDAGHLPCKLAFRTELHLSGAALPDIALMAEDATTPLVAIECKPDCYLHTLSAALGQCLLYQFYAPLAIICLPDIEAIPFVVTTIAARHGILIAEEHNFALFLRDALAQRNLRSLRCLFTDQTRPAPHQGRKRTVICLPHAGAACY